MQALEYSIRDVEIRRWSESDGVQELTELLHRAYAQLARLGFLYHASWQDAATTRRRLSKGLPLVAMCGESIVGTITLYLPPNVSGCDWYDRGDVACFGQFGIEPSLQRHGIGSQLLDAIESEARKQRVRNLSLDTAKGADHLITLYKRRGFVPVGFADWDVTNYRSIIMNKVLDSRS